MIVTEAPSPTAAAEVATTGASFTSSPRKSSGWSAALVTPVRVMVPLSTVMTALPPTSAMLPRSVAKSPIVKALRSITSSLAAPAVKSEITASPKPGAKTKVSFPVPPIRVSLPPPPPVPVPLVTVQPPEPLGKKTMVLPDRSKLSAPSVLSRSMNS